MALVMLIVFAPVGKIRNLARRWSAEHVPVFVEPDDYPQAVDEIQRALAEGGIQTTARPASRLLRIPIAVVTRFAGKTVQGLVAERLTTLHGDGLEAELLPFDLVL